VEQNGCEKKLYGAKPPEGEARRAEPKRQRCANERWKQGGSPVTESGKVEKSSFFRAVGLVTVFWSIFQAIYMAMNSHVKKINSKPHI
jgi:hypothetical protein